MVQACNQHTIQFVCYHISYDQSRDIFTIIELWRTLLTVHYGTTTAAAAVQLKYLHKTRCTGHGSGRWPLLRAHHTLLSAWSVWKAHEGCSAHVVGWRTWPWSRRHRTRVHARAPTTHATQITYTLYGNR